MPAIGSAEQVPVVGVDPRGGVVPAGDRRDAPHVVDVAVRDQHADRLEPVLLDDPAHAVGGVHAGVDDHALGAGSRRHDVAVGAPRTCGEAGDQHRPTVSVDRSQLRIGCGREVITSSGSTTMPQ